VPGIARTELAPVPPRVSSVVAPARAVNVVDAVVMLVVIAGEVASATTVPDPLVEYEVPHAEPVELAIPTPG
jgi:hypothetical protein